MIQIEKQEYHIQFEFRFDLTDDEVVYSHTSYKGKIYRSNGSSLPEEQEYIGSIALDMCHLQQIIDLQLDLEDYIDCNVCNELEAIFDTKENKLSTTFMNCQTAEISNKNILFISNISILPEFRGLHLGAYIIDMIQLRFKNNCGLLVGLVEPFQYSNYYNSEYQKEMRTIMKYDTFSNDSQIAFYKLMSYFTTMGFKVATALNEKIIFINTNEIEVKKLKLDL